MMVSLPVPIPSVVVRQVLSALGFLLGVAAAALWVGFCLGALRGILRTARRAV